MALKFQFRLSGQRALDLRQFSCSCRAAEHEGLLRHMAPGGEYLGVCPRPLKNWQPKRKSCPPKIGLALERGQQVLGKAIQVAEAQAAEFPEMGSSFKYGARRIIPRMFKFSLVYVATGVEVVVLAVAPFRRKPGYWKSRLSGGQPARRAGSQRRAAPLPLFASELRHCDPLTFAFGSTGPSRGDLASSIMAHQHGGKATRLHAAQSARLADR